MDILAFTDIHGDQATLDNLRRQAAHADIAICAGDMTMHGREAEHIISELDAFLCPVYIIHGNHDDPQTLTNLSLLADNVTYIHKQIIDLQTYHLIGHGGEGFSFTSDDFESFIQNTPLPQRNIILTTHQPPHNTALDQKAGRSTGNNSYRKFIDAHQPRLHIAGHMHENFNATDTVNNTQCVNPGPNGVILSV